MAREALVLDASVAVKWFSARGESALESALAIRNAHIAETRLIVVPDLFYYEVINALYQKTFIPDHDVKSAVNSLFALGLQTILVTASILAEASAIVRQYNITVYDSIYLAIAIQYSCPLVTANPRHQRPGLGCPVIQLERWRE